MDFRGRINLRHLRILLTEAACHRNPVLDIIANQAMNRAPCRRVSIVTLRMTDWRLLWNSYLAVSEALAHQGLLFLLPFQRMLPQFLIFQHNILTKASLEPH
jgi:hypothetical protein